LIQCFLAIMKDTIKTLPWPKNSFEDKGSEVLRWDITIIRGDMTIILVFFIKQRNTFLLPKFQVSKHYNVSLNCYDFFSTAELILKFCVL